MSRRLSARDFTGLLLLTVAGLLIAGYHPGCEDDGVYLSAIKRDLAPALYSHDSDFFALQLQASVFDKGAATLIRLLHVPQGFVLLALHVLTIYLILLGCLRIARRCFAEAAAQWCGVGLVSLLLTLPVAGTALYLVDQNLHPRAMATAAILAAIVAVLDRQWLTATGLLALSVLLHPMMGCYGISACVFLGWQAEEFALYALTPLGWLFAPVTKAWYVAANTRGYYFLSRWEWYEWLGVVAPFALLWWFRRSSLREGNRVRARIATRFAYFGLFQLVVALIVMLPPSLDRLKTFQPMRFLHLLTLICVLFSGAFLGRAFQPLRYPRRALLAAIPLAGVMCYAQRQTYPSSNHLEVPGTASANRWLQAFEWVRGNTPEDSFFAIGAGYMQRPGEDFHSFRALAERSTLADTAKDASVVTQVPGLAPLWLDQIEAQTGWEHFGLKDFDRLQALYGVDWVILEQPGVAGLNCPYENDLVKVCRIQQAARGQ